MKFCPECGSQLQTGTAKFCHNCGTSLWVPAKSETDIPVEEELNSVPQGSLN